MNGDSFDVAIEGCAHGELDKIYDMISFLNKEKGKNIQLLICCGDFQSVRNNGRDLYSMAVPLKFQKLNSFHYYHDGLKKAPCLTIFIGGNHEASDFLWELPYGGWVAPSIYYMGWSNVINFVIKLQKGDTLKTRVLRIAGISGIYKKHHYMLGHYEYPPLSEDTKRSIYHVRNIDIHKLSLIKQPLDICISHDWPQSIWKYGDVNQLLSIKPFFRADIKSDQLGCPPTKSLLETLKPDYWFSAHLHVKFAALYSHESQEENEMANVQKFTKFLALDKCLPKRKYLQIISFDLTCTEENGVGDESISNNKRKADDNDDHMVKEENPLLESFLAYDHEWLSVLKSSDHYVNTAKYRTIIPPPPYNNDFESGIITNSLDYIPIPGYDISANENKASPNPFNSQTVTFCQTFGLTNFCAKQMIGESSGGVHDNNNSAGGPQGEEDEISGLFNCFNPPSNNSNSSPLSSVHTTLKTLQNE